MDRNLFSTTRLKSLAHNSKQIHCRLLLKITFLLFCNGVFVNGQAQTPDTTLFKATGAFFALSVASAEASSKWYTEKLDMKVIMQIPRQDKYTVAVLEGGGLIVELIQNDDALPLSKVSGGITDNILIHGIFKAGVIVEDLDKLVATFRKRGVEVAYGPFPSRPGQRSNVIIKDNSGNLLQFFGK